jgi:hypothetical protein
VKKADGIICPVRVRFSDVVVENTAFLAMSLEEFVPGRVHFILSMEGTIKKVTNAEVVGCTSEQLIDKNVYSVLLSLRPGILCVLRDGFTCEHMLFSLHSQQSVLTSLKVKRTAECVELHFEIIDRSYELVLLLAEDGTIRECSRYSALQLCGYTRDELLHQNLNIIVPRLFPVAPSNVKFSCEAQHKEGHRFQMRLALRKMEIGVICQMRRNLSEFPRIEQEIIVELEVPGLAIGALLGTGGSSTVRLGQLSGVDQIAAVKIISKKEIRSAQREVEILKKLDHTSIPKLHLIAGVASCVVIVMEFCAGMELGYYLLVHDAVLITEEEAKHYFEQMVSVVSYIHNAGVIHRDIKLENIIVCGTGLGFCWKQNFIKLIDYGLSCEFKVGTMQDTFCGTPTYASPEIVRKKPYQGPESDVWALGIVLYVIVVGRFPFLSSREVLSTLVDTNTISSNSCAFLISQLLIKDISSRISVSQIRSHWWLNSSSDFRLVECKVMMDVRDEAESNGSNGSNATTPEEHGQKLTKRLLSGSSISSVADTKKPACV